MAAPENQLTRYGAIAKMLREMAPNAKFFFVGASTLPSFNDFSAAFPVDKDGGTRIFTTLAAAIADANVVASRGDFLFVLPGHTETMTSASSLSLSKAGLTIVGLGAGSLRPTVSFTTATAADFNLDAANITIENFIFDMTGIDAVAAGIDVNAAYATFRKCLFINASASAQATIVIDATASTDELVVEDCEFYGTSDAGTTTAIDIVGGNRHKIRRCTFIGAYSAGVGAIRHATTASLGMVIEDNHINNLTASSTKAMVFAASATGVIRRNSMQILSGTAPITGAAMSWVGANYYAATIATAGTLI